MIEEFRYGLVDANEVLVGYDDSCDYIYITRNISDATLTYTESASLENLRFFTEEYSDGILGKHPDLTFPLKLVTVEIIYRIKSK